MFDGTRLEEVAWTLAGGGASVFVTAIVLGREPVLASLVVLATVAAAWSYRAPPVAGAGLGVVAWLSLTGFDVHRFGDLAASAPDLARLGVLVAIGALSAACGRRSSGHAPARHLRLVPTTLASDPDHSDERNTTRG